MLFKVFIKSHFQQVVAQRQIPIPSKTSSLAWRRFNGEVFLFGRELSSLGVKVEETHVTGPNEQRDSKDSAIQDNHHPSEIDVYQKVRVTNRAFDVR